jgi:adenine-specific DNA-methyltransferase
LCKLILGRDSIIKKRNDSYPYFYQDAVIENGKLLNCVEIESGWSSKRIFELFIDNYFEPVLDTKGQSTTFYLTENGAIENLKQREKQSHVISSLMNMGSTQNMSNELKLMNIQFDYPKPTALIKYLISIVDGKDFIVLDSFAGSGTTGEAVMKLNRKDGGNRKFILVEMEDYAESITAERVKRVMKGYESGNKKIQGTGGDFNYYQVGKSIFLESNLLNEEVKTEKIEEYVWYTETKEHYQSQDEKYLLGKRNETAYYFYYEKDRLTTLDESYLRTLKTKASQYIIYADLCLLDQKLMDKYHIIFKKIPRDISRF